MKFAIVWGLASLVVSYPARRLFSAFTMRFVEEKFGADAVREALLERQIHGGGWTSLLISQDPEVRKYAAWNDKASVVVSILAGLVVAWLIV